MNLPSGIGASFDSAPTSLDGRRIKLIGLQAGHAEALFEIGNDPKIWQYFPRRVESRREMIAWVDEALRRRDEGLDIPFVIQDRIHNRIIGETRLIDYLPEHRQIEIAWTWFEPQVWGQGYGTESKLILLDYSFEKLDVIRVRITTHSCNSRARQHLERLGATLEGILRKDRIMPDGHIRDSAYYSVIVDEWPQVRRRISQILEEH